MELTLIGSTNNLKDPESMKIFSYYCGRQCYTEKDFDEIKKEVPKKQLLERMIESGHHSIFEHVWLTFNFKDFPKLFVMTLNNEKQYATSEKSARYTQMSAIAPEQKEKYDKWMDKLIPLIDEVYPKSGNYDSRKQAVKKLAQENARYMTSVFTPTKMVHTLNLRQLNFLISEFENFISKEYSSEDEIKNRLKDPMKKFLDLTQDFKVKGLENQTDRHLSIFNEKEVETFFGDSYSISHLMSFAAFAQAHRHRTINYHISDGTQLNAPFSFFVPEIVRSNGLEDEWIEDLERISTYDFPQAQLIKVNERGILEDFRSKTFLRMCGHAQYEIMKNTLNTAKKYAKFKEKYGENALKPKCMQGFKCNEPCVWSGKRALERIV